MLTMATTCKHKCRKGCGTLNWLINKTKTGDLYMFPWLLHLVNSTTYISI